MASAHLSQTISSSTGKKFTMSTWFKKTANDNINQVLHLTSDNNTHKYIDYATKSNYGIDFQLKNGSGGTYLRRRTNRLLRDFSGWYHVVIRFDSTQASAGDRLRIYINGEQATDIDTDSTPDVPQDYVTEFNTNGSTLWIGKNPSGSGYYFDGLMAHFHLTDGYSYAPTTFGETDATTGIWKPKTGPSVTYGTNGFFLEFDNSANMGLDSSGQSNNFTTNGTIIQTKDTPSHVFATLNRLQRYDDYNLTLLDNRFTNTSSGAHRAVHSNLAALSGKYYAEVKVTTLGGTYPQIGVINPDVMDYTSYLGASNKGYGYLSNGNKQYNNSATSWGNTYTTNDIIGIAMDLDNHKLYFSKNGTFQESGDPTSGSTGTGAAYSLATGVFYSFGGSSYHGGTNPVYDWNFGNGYFGTAAVASAGTNASGNGVFEFDVPAGYTALSTKGLNT